MYYMIKKLLPTTLFTRFLLIIVVPTILAQLVATYIFYERHWSNVSTHMLNHFVGEISSIVKLYQHQDNADILKLLDNSLSLETNFMPHEKLKEGRINYDLKPLYRALKSMIILPINIGYINDRSNISIDIELPNGVLNIIASRKRLDNPTTYIFILWMTGATAIFLGLSVVFLKNQLASISKLAEVAEKFGKGQPTGPLKPSGALEVRKAMLAFVQMKERIERQITQRTEMLAGVSHDLRTPLTRIKLQLAMLANNEEVQGMQNDVLDMEHMIQHYLDFARSDSGEKSALINLNDLLAELVQIYQKRMTSLTLSITGSIDLYVRPSFFKRALVNVLENAAKYASSAEVKVSLSNRYCTIEVEDDGPGINQNLRAEALKPFHRLDSSRNLNIGGTGLGLAITKDAIHAHGGKIFLDDSSLGGLKVIIRIPV